MYSMKNSQYTMISIRLCSARARCDSIAGAARGASARGARGRVLMAIMALLLPGGTAQGLGGGFRWDSDGVNGSYGLGRTCATPPGGLGLAVQTGEYAHHPAR